MISVWMMAGMAFASSEQPELGDLASLATQCLDSETTTVRRLPMGWLANEGELEVASKGVALDVARWSCGEQAAGERTRLALDEGALFSSCRAVFESEGRSGAPMLTAFQVEKAAPASLVLYFSWDPVDATPEPGKQPAQRSSAYRVKRDGSGCEAASSAKAKSIAP